MPIIVACQCGRKFQVKEEYAGRQTRCPVCKQVITIPDPNASAEPAPVEMEVGEEERMGGDDGAADQQEAPVNKAEEARRFKQAKLAKDAQMRKRYNIIAIASLGVMVAMVGGYFVFSSGGSSISDSGGASDTKAPDKDTSSKDPPPPPPPPSNPTEIAPPPGGEMDEVERYIQWAVNTKDECLRTNAKIFKPDEPRLKFDAKPRRPSMQMWGAFEKRRDVIAGKGDLEYAKPDPATDQLEARMLMDRDLIGSGLCMGWIRQASGAFFLGFVEPCKATMADIETKYGKPANRLQSGDGCWINCYGRIAIIELEGRKVSAIVRRMPKD